MDAEQTATIEFLSKNHYVLHVIVRAWFFIRIVLGVSGIAGGLFIKFGPDNVAAGSIPFRLLAGLEVPNEIVVWLMILGGILLFVQKLSVPGHLVLAVTFGWWGTVIPYAILILGQRSSLNAFSWAITLSLIHLIAMAAQIAIWKFLRGLPSDRSTGNG